ncbi:hypothetical protein KC363_g2134 [Hortaea werneckii]|nr:hypothetical protein KC363_g2134 [Hortaea werneckii]
MAAPLPPPPPPILAVEPLPPPLPPPVQPAGAFVPSAAWTAANNAGQPPEDHMCLVRRPLYALMGAHLGTPPGCLLFVARQDCAQHPGQGPYPGQPAHPNWNGCRNCYVQLNHWYSIQENARFNAPLVRKSRIAGQPKYLMDPNGVLALLCKHCESDEIEQYKRRIALGVAPPPEARQGWWDTCDCHNVRIRNRSRLGTGVMARWCAPCREMAADFVVLTATENATELQHLARDAAGARVSASARLRMRRYQQGQPTACRCGRDTVTPTLRPRATFCLCCGGVLIDHSQVKSLRNTMRHIRDQAAAGQLRVLGNLAPAFPALSSRPPLHRNAGIQVDVNNNKK